MPPIPPSAYGRQRRILRKDSRNCQELPARGHWSIPPLAPQACLGRFLLFV